MRALRPPRCELLDWSKSSSKRKRSLKGLLAPSVCCLPASPSLTAHCVAARLAEPVTAIITVTTLHGHRGQRHRPLQASRRPRGRLFVLDDLPAARSFSGVLVALACRLVDGLTVRPTFPAAVLRPLGRPSATHWDGPNGWRRPAAHRVISSACQI